MSLRAEAWPVPIDALGACAAATHVFRLAGKLHATAVIKATFAMFPGAAMRLTQPEPIHRVEVQHHDNPMRSVRVTSDLVAYLPRVDVVLTGHACAPAGTMVTSLDVRLAVFHQRASLDKTLHVHGDGDDDDLTPFERMPIVYERALGGVGYRDNPYGTGVAPTLTPPNILHAMNPQVVGCFGPLARALPGRKALLGKLSPKVLSQPIPDLPADFDWSYFQCAPADQQIASLAGNEWIVLEGMSAEHPRFTSRLPTARAMVVMFGLDPDQPDDPAPLVLKPDLLRIDADSLVCSLAFRAVIPIEDERALGTLRLVGGVDTEGCPLVIPASAPARANAVAAAPAAEHARAPSAATVSFDDMEITSARTVSRDGDAPAGQIMPFAAAPVGPRGPALPIAGAPWSPVHVRPPPPPNASSRSFDFTLTLDEPEPVAPPPPPLLPPEAPTPPPPTEVAAEPAVKPWSWAEPVSTADPVVTQRPAPPPRIASKPQVNKSVYGSFAPAKKR